jgi:hypothetical protein
MDCANVGRGTFLPRMGEEMAILLRGDGMLLSFNDESIPFLNQNVVVTGGLPVPSIGSARVIIAVGPPNAG